MCASVYIACEKCVYAYVYVYMYVYVYVHVHVYVYVVTREGARVCAIRQLVCMHLCVCALCVCVCAWCVRVCVDRQRGGCNHLEET